jgi:membrane-associated protease RseP (regulator of RpoE activity)
MKRTHSSGVWDTLLIVAVAAMAVTFSQATRAVADEADDEGRIVDITANDGDDVQPSADETDEAAPQAPTYWLGIEGMPLDSPVLRTHLQLAGDVGVVVRAVSANSPAEKAGLREHDIIIGVAGEQVTGMPVLQQAVAGSNAKPLELKVIRLAKEMTVSVTPEEMPKEIAEAQREGEPAGFNFNFNNIDDIFGNLPARGGGEMRIIGPGMILGGQAFDAGKLPGGVSVSITRENDGPAKITVKKGDQTWTVEGNDEEALKKLPEDVRPMVEQLLGQQGGRPFIRQFQIGQGGGLQLPRQLGQIDMDAIRKRTEEANQRMLKQMEQMEKQLRQMQQRFEERFPAEGTNPAADPSKT